MEPLQHVINGEFLEDVREKINKLIDAYNETFPVTRSYLDLEDKPAIDGIELLPESKMEDYKIPITSLPNEFDLQELFINAAKASAEIIAKQVAQEEVEKAFKLENIPDAQGFVNDDWKVLIYVPQSDGSMALYKTTMEEVTKKAVWASNNFEASTEENTLIIEG